MKYYKSEFWKDINSANSDIRKKAESDWNEAMKQYGSYFDTIKDKLPKKFIKEYYKHGGFHDYVFTDISISKIEKYFSAVDISINNDEKFWHIKLSGVSSILLDIPTSRNWLCGNLTWGYTEFELIESGIWVIRILCDIDCKIKVCFKKISIAKQ